MRRSQTPYQFFLAHAGYSYDPEQETRIEGKRRCAKELAKAEAQGKDLGLTFEWEHDQDADLSWMSAEELEQYRAGSLEMLCCVVRLDGKVLALLGGIAMYVDNRNYGRVVEAELASEAIAELQRIGAEVNG